MRERTIDVDGIQTWVRECPGEGTPVVFWHGNPTDADDWLPFMKRLGRPSFAADMPAFGRSPAPDAGFDCSVHAYGRWAEALLDELGVERYSLAIHDWGSIGLIPALAHPERIERLVSFNSVPFGVSYHWHVLARLVWRRRPAGEIANALSRGPVVGLGMTPGRPRFQAMPRSYVHRAAMNFSREATRDAILAPVPLGGPGGARRARPRPRAARRAGPSCSGRSPIATWGPSTAAAWLSAFPTRRSRSSRTPGIGRGSTARS